jgi:aryl-alcohol dehydrogenase-like predicted oxidoreductase
MDGSSSGAAGTQNGQPAGSIGLGCNAFGRRIDERASIAVASAAIDLGVRFYDTADMYGDGLSEGYLGRAVASRREECVIGTKFGGRYPIEPSEVPAALHASLRRLRTDYVDLYQLHAPHPSLPIRAFVDVLEDLKDRGYVRMYGWSNVTVADLEGAHRGSTVQNRYNLLDRSVEEEVLPWCRENGIGFICYSPLANGFLTGKYQRGSAPPSGSRLASDADRARNLLRDGHFDTLDAVRLAASKLQRAVLDVALGWLVQQPGVRWVIPGAVSVEQVKANLRPLDHPLLQNEVEFVRSCVESLES